MARCSPASAAIASRPPAPRSTASSAAAARRCCCCTAIRRRTRCGTGSRRALAERFTVVCSDLRGYGDSSKPDGGADHANYSKRAMAQDQVEVMRALGLPRFRLAGHDRGGRVAHRLCLDHPHAVERVAVLDISPTRIMYARTDKAFATAYYHWFFLIQPFDLPERLIGADPIYYLHRKLGGMGRSGLAALRSARARRVRALLQRSRDDPRDLRGLPRRGDDRPRARRGGRGDGGSSARCSCCGATRAWSIGCSIRSGLERASPSTCAARALPSGHFLAEEAPEETLAELRRSSVRESAGR